MATETRISQQGGEPVKDILQFDIEEVETGIFFPMRLVTVNYELGRIRMVEIVEIVEIEVNEVVDSSDFVVSTSPGELIRDFRGPDQEMFLQKRGT